MKGIGSGLERSKENTSLAEAFTQTLSAISME